MKSFLKSSTDLHVLPKIDSQTAVAYVNNMGGTISAQATLLARDLWMWCLNKNIHLSAQYLPGNENTIPAKESRVMKDSSN